MKTVEKAETFEVALEAVRKLNFPLKQFLIAFPEFANPISEDRLRDLLDSATKESIPYLWEIYACYKCLEVLKDEKDFYKASRDAIEWKIVGVVKNELKSNPPQDASSAMLLRDMAPEGSSARNLAENHFVIQLTGLIDKKKSIAQLVEDRKLFPEKYGIRDDLDQLIRHKTNKRLGEKLIVAERFDLIVLVGDILPYIDKVKGLRPIVKEETSVDDLLRANGLLITDDYNLQTSTVGFEGTKLCGHIWSIVIAKTKDRDLWWTAARFGTNNWVWDDTCISARLKILKASPSFQELLEMFLETRGVLYDYRGLEYYQEFLDLLVAQFKEAIGSAMAEKELRQLYGDIEACNIPHGNSGKISWWQQRIKSMIIRRLYELSQSK